MVSFGNALVFAFNKRGLIIGSILLFLTLLLMAMLGYTLYKLGPEYIQVLQNISAETARNIGYFLYALKTFFYSILFAYFFILAKKEVYNQSDRFSGEFFCKVLVTIFAFKLISDLILYASSDFIKGWVLERIMAIALHPTTFEITKTVVIALGVSMLFSFCVSAIYMAYLMHFNFSSFLYKLKYTFSSPLTFLKMMGLFILFILLSMVPVIGLYFVLGSFDAQTVAMAFASCMMGRGASAALLFYAIFVGTPIALFCIGTVSGRIFGCCITLFYFVLYGILRLMGMPSFPFSALLYLYVFFFLVNLLYVIGTIIYPAFWIHLMAQGTLEVNRKFEPLAGLSKEEKLLTENSNNESM